MKIKLYILACWLLSGLVSCNDWLDVKPETEMTLEEIGSRFNRRHSSVLKGITSLEREISRQSPVGRQISHTVRMIEKNSLHV